MQYATVVAIAEVLGIQPADLLVDEAELDSGEPSSAQTTTPADRNDRGAEA